MRWRNCYPTSSDRHYCRLILTVYPYDEVFEILSHLHLHPYYDLLRIDMACFPLVSEKHYYRWNRSPSSRYCWITSLSKFNSTSARWMGLHGQFPLMPVCKASVLSTDLFEDATIKRMFYESTGKELTLQRISHNLMRLLLSLVQRHPAKK